MKNGLDILNVNLDDFNEAPVQSNNSANLFKPDPSKSSDGIYTAIVRPVYWFKDSELNFNPKLNYIEKKTFYLKSGTSDSGTYYDSPFSVGDNCQAMMTFFRLNKEGKAGNVRSKDLADEIKPKSSYFYLVYVENDVTTPSNNGKLMVWKAPIQIHKLINSKINPDEAQIKLGKKREDIFNPLTGRSIEVSVSKGKWWNYDDCVWGDKGPIQFNGNDFTANDNGDFVELLKGGTELMTPYIYEYIGDDKYQELLDIITDITGAKLNKVKKDDNVVIEGYDEDVKDEVKSEPTPKPTEVEETDSDVDDINNILDGLELGLED